MTAKLQEGKGIIAPSTSRMANLELLRIVLMAMVVLLHAFGYSSLKDQTVTFSLNNTMSWYVYAFARVAVNCFVLLSGYFMCKSTVKLKKMVLLWGKTYFYLITITAIMVICGISKLTAISAARTLFPVTLNAYWFFSCYICLMLLSPFLNVLINNISKKKHLLLIAVCLLFFSVPQSLIPNYFTLDNTLGYGIIWFVLLYLVASYVRLYKPFDNKKWSFLVVYIVASSMVFLIKMAISIICSNLNLSARVLDHGYNYNSILIFIASFAFFMFFLKINIKNQKAASLICSISPFAFSIYLIHNHFLLAEPLWTNLFKINNFLDSWALIPLLFVFTITICAVCILIDFIRRKVTQLIAQTAFGKKLNKLFFKNKFIVKLQSIIE